MRKINILYIVALALGLMLYLIYTRVQTDSAFFYGFAENKETEISHDKDVLIEKILVTTGQKVKKGELLMVVKNTLLPIKMDEIELKKQIISLSTNQNIKQIKYKISDLQFTKLNKLQEVTAKINELNNEIELNESLYKGLKSIHLKNDTSQSSKEIQVDFLVTQLTSIASRFDKEIDQQRRLLNAIKKPAKLETTLLDTKAAQFKNEQDKLSIYAPSDGLIGNILCKEQENISSFNTLLNFYQINPTLVKGFVHESLLLQVKVGNELEVTSSMHAQHKVVGKVIGLGSRIVEIPERLRKMPDIKTYGREVMIRISSDNNFLQKEKVMLNVVM